MEQNKYKEQIQNGSLSPSSDSWERLSKKLKVHENKQKNNKWHYIKYAVSILIIFSISLFFFKPKNDFSKIPVLKEQFQISPDLNIETETFIAEPVEISPLIPPVENKPAAIKVTDHRVDEAVAQNTKIDIDKVISKTSEDESLSNEKIENMSVLTSSISEVTDAEIDQLLNSATINLSRNSQNSFKTGLSAIDLLGEIEDDLEKDTRRKLFEKIIITIKNPTEIEITDRSK